MLFYAAFTTSPDAAALPMPLAYWRAALLILAILGLVSSGCGDEDPASTPDGTGGAAGIAGNAGTGGDRPDASPETGAWVDDLQTYCMVPMVPERATELHATVNGVWGGMGGTDPILSAPDVAPAVQNRYGQDAAAFVDDSHASGLRAVSVVNGLEGYEVLRDAIPNFDDLACRDADGNIYAPEPGVMTVMCTNNPGWIAWELEVGKRGIDLGADLINLDTPMASSFVSGVLKAGMCDHCMARFERWLEDRFTPAERETRFGLSEFDAQAIRQRLKGYQFLNNPQARPFLEDSPDAMLFREFIACQEAASFETRKGLIDELRIYAASQGREVAFCTNAADLGTGNPAGHWIRALMFADLVDFFAYEQNVLPDGMSFRETCEPLPRGKWAGYHKLAHAIHHRRSPAVIHAGNMGVILGNVLEQDITINTWMGVLEAEAYAANGAFIQYYVEPIADDPLLFEPCWKESARIADYLLQHKDLYDGDLTSGSPLGAIFLYNERGRTIPAVWPSFFGLSNALTEGAYPYDVVFGGDGRYVLDRMTAADLARYQTIVVPSPVDPTDNQKQLIDEFVQAGGNLVCLECDRLGITLPPTLEPESTPALRGRFDHGHGRVLVLEGTVEPAWTDDVGSRYFRDYQQDQRAQIWSLFDALGVPTMLDLAFRGRVGVFPIHQPARGRVVVHFVNYDIDQVADAPNVMVSIPFHVPVPDFVSGELSVQWHEPGAAAPVVVEAAVNEGTVTGSIPSLEVMGSLTIEAGSSGKAASDARSPRTGSGAPH